MPNIFSQQFRELRKASALSQEDISERLGITPQAVSKWECAQSYPDIELLAEIAGIFNVSIDRLLTGKNNYSTFTFPDDETLRILTYKGHTPISTVDTEQQALITLPEDLDIKNIEVYGSCAIAGDLSCDTIRVSGHFAAYDIDGDVMTNGNISCGNIDGDLNVSNGNINCGNIKGDIYCEGNISCSNLSGDINYDL